MIWKKYCSWHKAHINWLLMMWSCAVIFSLIQTKIAFLLWPSTLETQNMLGMKQKSHGLFYLCYLFYGITVIQPQRIRKLLTNRVDILFQPSYSTFGIHFIFVKYVERFRIRVNAKKLINYIRFATYFWLLNVIIKFSSLN